MCLNEAVVILNDKKVLRPLPPLLFFSSVSPLLFFNSFSPLLPFTHSQVAYFSPYGMENTPMHKILVQLQQGLNALQVYVTSYTGHGGRRRGQGSELLSSLQAFCSLQ